MKTQRTKAHEYRVLKEMNNNNAINVIAPSANRVYQIVDYEDDRIRDELATLDPGKLVSLRLDRVGKRANVWRASWPDGVESLVATK